MSAIPVKSKIESDKSLKISPFKEVIKPTFPHKHADYYELILLEEGAGTHIIDDQRYEVVPPMSFFLKPGQTHCWEFSRIPKGYVILFREELLNPECLDIVYNLPVNIFLKDDSALFELARYFYSDYRSEVTQTVLNTYLQLILLKTRERVTGEFQTDKLFNPLYYQFKSLLNEHFYQIKRINVYAEMLNIPAAQLNMICKTASGRTPSMLLNERIVLEARTLLSNTTLSVKEITDVLNISDPSNFVKFFKLYTNLTPGQYRELAAAKLR